MGLFTFFRPKWKDPDPSVRLAAISVLENQSDLETIAERDPSDPVRVAAVQKLTNQEVLLRLTRAPSTVAVAAVQRISDPLTLVSAAMTAPLALVRELAVERIDDDATLRRIAAVDTDAWVRLRARIKSTAPDRARAFIRGALAELLLAEDKAQAAAEFAGTLDEICTALLRDRRFRINGGLEAQSVDLTGKRVAASTCAELLALKRAESGDPDETKAPKFFYHIKIWRTAQDTYRGSATETKVGHGDVLWSQAPWPCPESSDPAGKLMAKE